jgi:hypothetical protein
MTAEKKFMRTAGYTCLDFKKDFHTVKEITHTNHIFTDHYKIPNTMFFECLSQETG